MRQLQRIQTHGMNENYDNENNRFKKMKGVLKLMTLKDLNKPTPE